METLEKQILDIIQDEFPIEDRPYALIAKKLGITEIEVFETVEKLRNKGIIRRLGGVYNSKKLGFISRLCAGKIPVESNDKALNEFASVVNNINAITHNYVRSHEYNVWFTIIAENEAGVKSIVDKLCASTKLSEVHIMSANKMFKINTVMGKSTSQTHVERGCGLHVLQESDKNRIRILSGDLPHSLTPFADLKIPLDAVQNDLDSGVMRRFGAILRHQQAGFTANAMVCFQVENVELAGSILAACPSVSHCYERAPFEKFPFNLYAMFHGTDKTSLLQAIDVEKRKLGNPPMAVLNSLQELKKTSYTFFE